MICFLRKQIILFLGGHEKNTARRNFHFASANLDNLAKDIAIGKGESLETLAELMSVPASSRHEFNARLQKNFAAIFPNGNVDYAQVLDSIYVLTVNA